MAQFVLIFNNAVLKDSDHLDSVGIIEGSVLVVYYLVCACLAAHFQSAGESVELVLERIQKEAKENPLNQGRGARVFSSDRD